MERDAGTTNTAGAQWVAPGEDEWLQECFATYATKRSAVAVAQSNRLDCELALDGHEWAVRFTELDRIAEANKALPRPISDTRADELVKAALGLHCGGSRLRLANAKIALVRAEGEASIAREALRLAYARFALATGHNMIGASFPAL